MDTDKLMENAAFTAFLYYGALVFLKLLAMSPITILYRMILNNFMNLEDTKFSVYGYNDPETQKRALVPNETVNRVKRAHANDIESIVPFAILGIMYVLTNPDAAMATWLFKIFTVARYAHTFIYLCHVPQPTRFLAFLVGFCVNAYMAVQILIACQ